MVLAWALGACRTSGPSSLLSLCSTLGGLRYWGGFLIGFFLGGWSYKGVSSLPLFHLGQVIHHRFWQLGHFLHGHRLLTGRFNLRFLPSSSVWVFSPLGRIVSCLELDTRCPHITLQIFNIIKHGLKVSRLSFTQMQSKLSFESCNIDDHDRRLRGVYLSRDTVIEFTEPVVELRDCFTIVPFKGIKHYKIIQIILLHAPSL